MTPNRQSARLRELCATVPVVPVVVIENAALAEPLARALVAGGLPVIEVTLRTPAALDAIRAMSSVPGAIVGAGTVLSPADVHAAQRAGAGFAVSPALAEPLFEPCTRCALPLLPGVATATEAMQAREAGYDFVKFFPAGPAGGPAYLKALGGPLPGIAFCPTGGVSPQNAGEYLALPNVLCVGGTWLTPPEMLAAGDWSGIAAMARTARGLRA